MFFFLLSLATEIYSKETVNTEIMDVTNLPFNRMIGLKYSDNPDYMLMLADNANYHNHLQTVHASAQFALAEATSGHFLLNEFQGIDGVIPVVRSSAQKFRKPGQGSIYSRAKFKDVEKETVLASLRQGKRIALTVEVSLYDEAGVLVMQASFDWVVLPQGTEK